MSDLDLAASQATNQVATRELVATLQALLQKRGDSLLSNRRMFLGLMRDYAPDKARAIRLLLAAFDFDTPRRMKAMAALDATDVASEAQSLSSETGLREDLARWATGLWGEALGAAAQARTAPAAPPPIAPVRKIDDLTWSSPAAPAAFEPATPPPAAPVSKAEDLTWSSPVAPVAQTPQPAAPEPPPSAPVGKADDLTWSSPVAPAAQTPQAAAPAMLQPQAASTGPWWKRGSGGTWVIRLSSIIVTIVFIISTANRLGLFSSDKPTPPEQPGADQPAQPPADQPAANPNDGGVVGKQGDGTPIVMASTSTNPNDWPRIPGAVHPGGNPLAWTYMTVIKFPDGQRYLYNTYISLNANLTTGTATVSSADFSKANGKNLISTSKVTPVVRSLEKASGIYRVDVAFVDWADNAAKAPPICMTINSGQVANKFDPLVFCAAAVVNGACTPTWIGCGSFQ